MRDPLEGRTVDGRVRTGASARRISPQYRTALSAAVGRIVAVEPAASVYVYGSVATGQACAPSSDIDLLTVGASGDAVAEVASELTAEFAHLSRSVEIAPANAVDFDGGHDAAYGGRAFLHHYCVHLAGPDHDQATEGFPADRRLARAFNGDIATHVSRWLSESGHVDPGPLGRRVARKTLLAVAGLVSVHDDTWTTDRLLAAQRWKEISPRHAARVGELGAWAFGEGAAASDSISRGLETADAIAERFASEIGLWNDAAG